MTSFSSLTRPIFFTYFGTLGFGVKRMYSWNVVDQDQSRRLSVIVDEGGSDLCLVIILQHICKLFFSTYMVMVVLLARRILWIEPTKGTKCPTKVSLLQFEGHD